MKANVKILSWVGGAIALIGGGSALLIRYNRIKNKKRQEQQLEEAKQQLEDFKTSVTTPSSSVSTNSNITPKRSPVTLGINNSLSEIKGVLLYPAQKSNNYSKGYPNALGYTNLRSSAEVNNKSSWYDMVTNLIGKIITGMPVGTIISEKYDNMSPSNRWFLVSLNKPIKIFGKNVKGAWVRADTVTFRPFKKTSSFQGKDDSNIRNIRSIKSIKDVRKSAINGYEFNNVVEF